MFGPEERPQSQDHLAYTTSQILERLQTFGFHSSQDSRIFQTGPLLRSQSPYSNADQMPIINDLPSNLQSVYLALHGLHDIWQSLPRQDWVGLNPMWLVCCTKSLPMVASHLRSWFDCYYWMKKKGTICGISISYLVLDNCEEGVINYDEQIIFWVFESL